MNNYDYRNLRLMINMSDASNKAMMQYLDALDKRERNKFIITAIKQHIAGDNKDKSGVVQGVLGNEVSNEEYQKLVDAIRNIEARLVKLEQNSLAAVTADIENALQPEMPEPEKSIQSSMANPYDDVKASEHIPDNPIADSIPPTSPEPEEPEEPEEYEVPDFALNFIDSLN